MSVPEAWKSYFEGTNIPEIPENAIPSPDKIYRAFELIDPDSVKFVILGQDPYPNPENATGLAFHVPLNQKKPASLKNIFENLKKYGHDSVPEDLEEWSRKYGILLVNCALTTSSGKSNTHASLWNPVILSVLKKLNEKKKPKFLLFGAFSIKVGSKISGISAISCSHPSPLSYKKPCGVYPSFYETDVFTGVFDEK